MKRFLFLLFFYCKTILIISTKISNEFFQNVTKKATTINLKNQINYAYTKQVQNSLEKKKEQKTSVFNSFIAGFKEGYESIFILSVPFILGDFAGTSNGKMVAFIHEKIQAYENNYIPQLTDPLQKNWEKHRSIYKNMNQEESFLDFLKIQILRFYLDFFNLKTENSKDIEEAEAFLNDKGKIFQEDLISIFNNKIPPQIHLIQEMLFQDYKPKNIQQISSPDDEDEITYKNKILSDEITHFCQWFKDSSGLYQQDIFSGSKAFIEIENNKVYRIPFSSDNIPITIGDYTFNQFSFIEKINYIYLVAESFKYPQVSLNSVDYTININQKMEILSKVYKLLEDCEKEDEESVKKFYEKSILINNNKILANCVDGYFQLKFYLDLFNYMVETTQSTNTLVLMDSSSKKFNPVVVEKIKKAQDNGIRAVIDLKEDPISKKIFFASLTTCGSLTVFLGIKRPPSIDDDNN